MDQCYILYEAEIIFPEILFRYQNTSHIFACNVIHGLVKLFAEASEFFMHAFFAVLRRPKNDFLGVHRSRGQKDGSRRLLKRDSRESEKEQIQVFLRVKTWVAPSGAENKSC